MKKALLSKFSAGLERVFAVDGKVVLREELLTRELALGTRAVLEILKTDKSTLYLHSNLQESHTYFQCTATDLSTFAATILEVAK